MKGSIELGEDVIDQRVVSNLIASLSGVFSARDLQLLALQVIHEGNKSTSSFSGLDVPSKL